MHPRKLHSLMLSSRGAGILELRWFAPLFRGAGISGLHLLPPLSRRAGVGESRGGGWEPNSKPNSALLETGSNPGEALWNCLGRSGMERVGEKRVTGGRGGSRRWCKDTGWWWGGQIRAMGGAGYTKSTGRRRWGDFFRILIRGWCFVSGNMPISAKAHESNTCLAFGFEKWHRLCGGYRRCLYHHLALHGWFLHLFFACVSLKRIKGKKQRRCSGIGFPSSFSSFIKFCYVSSSGGGALPLRVVLREDLWLWEGALMYDMALASDAMNEQSRRVRCF